jgi:hypothetical protein
LYDHYNDHIYLVKVKRPKQGGKKAGSWEARRRGSGEAGKLGGRASREIKEW